MAIIQSTSYSIVIGKNALNALSTFLKKRDYQQLFILCDDNTIKDCLPILITSCLQLKDAEIIEVESGESAKSLEFCAYILQTLLENRADKNTLFINLGGGVVSDLGGFCASIYKRGIDFVNIPTSLLAMADASVGGKTGIDLIGVKNVVGTFTQPKAVFIYPQFLNTLPEKHFKNGLAEIYKIALVADRSLWSLLKNKTSLNKIDKLIALSVALKNSIVKKDPYDRGIRKTLNFGHTVGHALESMFLEASTELLHGEAIVIGMMIESHIAFQKKLISKQMLNEINAELLTVFSPMQLPELMPETFFEFLHNDKKNTDHKLMFALPIKIGASKYDIPVKPSQIKLAIKYYNALLL
jgi:3-dehydroquinate synthase